MPEDGAGGGRQGMEPEDAGIRSSPRHRASLRRGGTSRHHSSFLGEQRCQSDAGAPPGCTRCSTTLPARGFGCHGCREGRSRDGAEAGWSGGGGAAKARGSEGRKPRGRSTAPSVRLQGGDGHRCCGGTRAQHGDRQGRAAEPGMAGAELPILPCLKPEPCLVPPLLLLPEG